MKNDFTFNMIRVSINVGWMEMCVNQSENGNMINVDVSANILINGVLIKMIICWILVPVIVWMW